MSKQSNNSDNDNGSVFQKKLERSTFLKTTGLTTAGLFGNLLLPYAGVSFLGSTRKSLPYPFKLGVASGDPFPHGVVLWTRLAPDPMRGGGMPNKPVEVIWQVAKTATFNSIIKEGKVPALPKDAHSIHVEVDNLNPNRWYFYRFIAEDETSPVGRTRTMPSSDAKPPELNIAFASCQKYFDGYYTAYNHMVKDKVDLVFFLGDYIYEYAGNNVPGRKHVPDKEIYSLEEYRIRYGQYKSDPSLQAAHAAYPWIATLDDHEIQNDWAGIEGSPLDYFTDFKARRAAAFKAYYEHMPLRKSARPENMDMQLYRSFTFGKLCEFNVLDTRQYRTDFACQSDESIDAKKCLDISDTSRTMLGEQQEKWLFEKLKKSTAQWNILPQQVIMAQLDMDIGKGMVVNTDKWDGYKATRDRLFKTIKSNDLTNLTVLTGDFHRNMANNLHEDFDDPDSPILATELVGTSIASNGDGRDIDQYGKLAMRENPHIKFYNAQRGYVHCKITPNQIQANYRVVPFVSKTGADIKTRATFEINNQKPGLKRI